MSLQRSWRRQRRWTPPSPSTSSRAWLLALIIIYASPTATALSWRRISRQTEPVLSGVPPSLILFFFHLLRSLLWASHIYILSLSPQRLPFCSSLHFLLSKSLVKIKLQWSITLFVCRIVLSSLVPKPAVPPCQNECALSLLILCFIFCTFIQFPRYKHTLTSLLPPRLLFSLWKE